jgi:hypothetical protein
MGFIWSKINECVYFRGSTIFFCYVDDSVLIDPNKENIDKVFAKLQALKYNITDEGQINDYIGIKIKWWTDGTIKLSQPHLINQVLDDLNLLHSPTNNSKYKAKSQDNLAPTAVILGCNIDGEPHNQNWSYCSVIGNSTFLRNLHAQT